LILLRWLKTPTDERFPPLIADLFTHVEVTQLVFCCVTSLRFSLNSAPFGETPWENIEHEFSSFKLSLVVEPQEVQLGCEPFSRVFIEKVQILILEGKMYLASGLVDSRHVSACHQEHVPISNTHTRLVAEVFDD
jgi:hypothetical protein